MPVTMIEFAGKHSREDMVKAMHDIRAFQTTTGFAVLMREIVAVRDNYGATVFNSNHGTPAEFTRELIATRKGVSEAAMLFEKICDKGRAIAEENNSTDV